jgi:hypothetical protein
MIINPETGMVSGYLRVTPFALEAFADGRWLVNGEDADGKRYAGYLEAVSAGPDGPTRTVLTLTDPTAAVTVISGHVIHLQTGAPTDEATLQAARDRAVERTLFTAEQVVEFEETYGITWAALEVSRLLDTASFHQRPVLASDRPRVSDYHDVG